jgi:hypothetical protein
VVERWEGVLMSDLQREKFERWFFEEVDGGAVAESIAWQAWCAAIESVVVELPFEDSSGITD